MSWNTTSPPGGATALKPSWPNGNVTPFGGGTCGAAPLAAVSTPPVITVTWTVPPAVDTAIVGCVNVTVLSVDVEAVLALLAASWATPAARSTARRSTTVCW